VKVQTRVLLQAAITISRGSLWVKFISGRLLRLQNTLRMNQ